MYRVLLFDLFGTLIEFPETLVYLQNMSDIASGLRISFEPHNEPYMSINDGHFSGSYESP